MCHYRKIREELGTINYNPISESIPNPKIDLVEMFRIEKKKIKKEKKKSQKKRTIRIDHDKKSKIDKILELTSDKVDGEDIEQEKINEEEKKEEEIEKEEEVKIEDEIKVVDLDMGNTEETFEIAEGEEIGDTDIEEIDIKETEIKEDIEGQSGGQINPFKKRIYVTNLTVDKDKEMFQM